jgi:hypothetical protein
MVMLLVTVVVCHMLCSFLIKMQHFKQTVSSLWHWDCTDNVVSRIVQSTFHTVTTH